MLERKVTIDEIVNLKNWPWVKKGLNDDSVKPVARDSMKQQTASLWLGSKTHLEKNRSKVLQLIFNNRIRSLAKSDAKLKVRIPSRLSSDCVLGCACLDAIFKNV